MLYKARLIIKLENKYGVIITRYITHKKTAFKLKFFEGIKNNKKQRDNTAAVIANRADISR